MANITDKELLAICNFSNLKLEFAKLERTIEKKTTAKNHTIASIIEKELEALKARKDGKGNLESHAFITDESPRENVYDSISHMTGAAGYVVGLYGNGYESLNNYEILYAAMAISFIKIKMMKHLIIIVEVLKVCK